MKRLRASLAALIITVTTLFYAYVLYKPSDHEQHAESPTEQADVLIPPDTYAEDSFIRAHADRTKPLEPVKVAEKAPKPVNTAKDKRQTESKAESFTVEATFYTAKCNGCSGITASGYDVRRTITYKGLRIVAMSKDIPLYTIVNVKLTDGSEFKAIVLDRGGAIKRGKMDVLVATKSEAYRLGRQQAQVTILERGGR